jgi:ribosomal protein S18 acetylase RimI-like enzyme
VFLLAAPRQVGVAQLRFRAALFSGGRTCYLEELYVVPDRRGEGHGRALMDAALRVARERGATTMEVVTAASDTAARGLYEAVGFSNRERKDDPATRMLFYERPL